jgi:hypothetical protein
MLLLSVMKELNRLEDFRRMGILGDCGDDDPESSCIQRYNTDVVALDSREGFFIAKSLSTLTVHRLSCMLEMELK